MSARRAYAPPEIRRLAATPVGKHFVHDGDGATARRAGSGEVEQLLRQFGSPLFLVSEPELRSLFRSFRDTFTTAGVETRIAYSYKTNYLPAICAVLASEGAWAEVVSDMEYRLARALGTPPGEIVFNGPHKTREALDRALGEGALVNVDGFDELELIEAAAQALRRTVRVGLRVHVRHGTGAWTKFGFGYESGEAREALARVARTRRLRLVALHQHSGTFNVNPEQYAQAARALVDLARGARRLGLKPTVIDLGGGFPSSNQLKPAYDIPGRRPEASAHARFAEAILAPVARAKGAFGGTPTLVLEPGRAVVDAAVQLACRVVAVKNIPGEGPAVVVDAGVNVLPTAYYYDHPVEAVRAADDGAPRKLRPTRVFGPLCMQIDVVRERAPLPELKVGAPLVVGSVGAYCLTQSMQFIEPRPAVVLLGRGKPEVIRRRESWRDVFALDHVPARLRRPGHSL